MLCRTLEFIHVIAENVYPSTNILFPPTSSLWQPTFHSKSLIIFFFKIPKVRDTILYWSFSVWLMSSSIMPCGQFNSNTQSCPTLCDPMDCSTPGFPVHHQLPEFTQTHVHWVGDAIQPFHPLSSPSPPTVNLSQYQDLFRWVGSSHQAAKVSEFQLQHQSFPGIFRTDFL